MPFPAVERVIYKKNPLEKVICQLRFPPILIIDSELPAKFQDLIREEYPHYEENIEVQQEISTDLNSGSLNPMSNITRNKNHVFVSEDGQWQINLTRTFISLSTTNYVRWEDFKAKFEKPLNALIKVYRPPYFTRIGLRYVDVFCRSVLGLNGCEWRELIKPQFLGLLDSEVRESVDAFTSQCEVVFDDKVSRVRIVTDIVKKAENNEDCFMLDSDSYTPSIVNTDDAISQMDYIHKRSSRLIRFVIKDKLHDGMEPNAI